MKMIKRILVLPLVLIGLSACGFSPMYGSGAGRHNEIGATLEHIEIANIPDREGQFLRNALIDRFYKEGRPDDALYIVHISAVQERIVDLDITKSSDATRSQLKLLITMVLKDTKSGDAVLTRRLTAISSFNVLTSEFATRLSKQNTRENALNDLARQVELQIGLYLRRQ